jgi:hypothetical protein
MCVVDPNYRYEDDGGEGPEPTTESDGPKKSWYEGDEDFYTNPKDYIEKQLGRGEYKKEAMIGFGLMPGLGLAAGIANKVDDLNGIAKARASFEINRAFKTEGFEKGNPWADNMEKTLNGLGNNLLASGNMYKNSFARDLDFDSWEDATGSDINEAARRKDAYAKSRAIERARLQREEEAGGPTYVSPEEKAFVEEILKDQNDGGSDGDGGNNTPGGAGNIGRGGGSGRAGAIDPSKPPSPSSQPNSSPTRSNGSSKNNRSPSNSGGSPTNDFESGLQHNKGGLMTKNKEKPRNYKKGGLASRKK